MDFFNSLKYLYGLGHETVTMKFGLRNTQIMLAAFDNPQQSFLKIQIVGTNGKGSVCAFLESICLAANAQVGLYTSPHLIEITERIKINGREISQTEFAKLTTQVRRKAQQLIEAGEIETLPTFFEHLTIIALLAFRAAKIDVAVLETGLGGRLDSTTAANAEIVGITSISLDHQEYLGNTLEEIAAEKAAVIRSDARAVIARQDPVVMNIIRDRCRESGIKPLLVENDSIKIDEHLPKMPKASFKTETDFYSHVEINLPGRHQFENAATAVLLAETARDFGLEISHNAIIQGLKKACHAGRLELWENRKPQILFDGAHNVAGAKALRKFLQEFYDKTSLTIIFGAMRDKDLAEIAAEVFPLAANLILTRADHPRSAMLEDLQKFAADLDGVYLASNAAQALQTARRVTSPNALICVTGSLYLVGETQKIMLAENSEINEQFS